MAIVQVTVTQDCALILQNPNFKPRFYGQQSRCVVLSGCVEMIQFIMYCACFTSQVQYSTHRQTFTPHVKIHISPNPELQRPTSGNPEVRSSIFYAVQHFQSKSGLTMTEPLSPSSPWNLSTPNIRGVSLVSQPLSSTVNNKPMTPGTAG